LRMPGDIKLPGIRKVPDELAQAGALVFLQVVRNIGKPARRKVAECLPGGTWKKYYSFFSYYDRDPAGQDHTGITDLFRELDAGRTLHVMEQTLWEQPFNDRHPQLRFW